MLWKSRWTGDWFLRKAADQPNRARIQDNQILISAYDEVLTRTCICNRLRLVNFPSVPELSNDPRFRQAAKDQGDTEGFWLQAKQYSIVNDLETL